MTVPTAPGTGKTTNNTSFPNPDMKRLVHTPTSVDAHGIERIAGPHIVGWKPARMEASDAEKAHMDYVNKSLTEAADTRAGVLTTALDDDSVETTVEVGVPPVKAQEAAEVL